MRAIEKRLRERIKELEAKLSNVEADRNKFRRDTVNNLKSAISIHGDGKYWNMASMIETLAKQIHDKDQWWL